MAILAESCSVFETFNEFKSFKILNVKQWNWQVCARRTENWSWSSGKCNRMLQYNILRLLDISRYLLLCIAEVHNGRFQPWHIWLAIRIPDGDRTGQDALWCAVWPCCMLWFHNWQDIKERGLSHCFFAHQKPCMEHRSVENAHLNRLRVTVCVL
jgi:hypothetical protein